MRKNKRKTGVFVILTASLLVTGCSFQDLMFWKKKANDNKVEPTPENKPEPQPQPELYHKDKNVNVYCKI